MNTLLKKIIFIYLSSLLIFIQNAAATELQPGSIAPSFELKDQNFKTHTLEDYQTKWLVLYFYPKDDTPGCTTEACQFRDDIFKLKALNAKVLGVSVDDSKSHEEFAKKYSLPFPLLADTNTETSKAYGALSSYGTTKRSKRHTFIIGKDSRIKKIYRDVSPKHHSQQVIDDLKNLIANEK